MGFPCDLCETLEFCQETNRCIDKVLVDHYGETSLQEVEDLAEQDSEVVIPDIDDEVFDTPITNKVRSIIQKAIKGT